MTSAKWPADETNPWRTLETEVRYQNDWMTVEENQVVRPDGNPGIYGVVRPKNLAIGIIPLDEEQHTWLVGQYRYPLDVYSWEIIEGGGPYDEGPEQSAARELKEEAGLEARRFDEIMRMHTSNCITDEKAIIFVARELNSCEAQPDPTEQLQLVRVPFSEAVTAVMEGRITDAMSVAGILKTAALLADGQLCD